MSLIANQPSSIAKILDASFKLYAASFKKVIGYGLIIGVIYLVLTVAMNQLMPVGTNPEQFDPMMMESLSLVMGLMFVSSIAALIFYAAMIYRIDNLVCGRDDSFGEGLWIGLKKFPAMFFGMFLYMIAVMVGTLLLVVPGIILWLSLLFYVYFIVVENSSAYGALKASHKLVWGNWWRTLMVFMVPGIMLMVVYMVIGLLVAVLGIEAATSTPLNLVDIFSNLIIGVIMPYFYALGYVQYRDMKLRKSGGDFEARMTQDVLS